jgi:hypothetical protein
VARDHTPTPLHTPHWDGLSYAGSPILHRRAFFKIRFLVRQLARKARKCYIYTKWLLIRLTPLRKPKLRNNWSRPTGGRDVHPSSPYQVVEKVACLIAKGVPEELACVRVGVNYASWRCAPS